MAARAVDGWTFITNPFSTNCEIPLNKFHEQLDIYYAVLFLDVKLLLIILRSSLKSHMFYFYICTLSCFYPRDEKFHVC